MFYQLRRIDTCPGKVKNKNIILDYTNYSLILFFSSFFWTLNCSIDVCKKHQFIFDCSVKKIYTWNLRNFVKNLRQNVQNRKK